MTELLQHDFRGRFGKGYHPDTHDKSQDISARALFGAIMRLPAEYSLEASISQVYDQGPTSACVGWAFAQAVKLRCAVAGSPIGLPSPTAWYTGARATERNLLGLTPEQSPLQDNGSTPSLAVMAAQTIGIPSNDVWPFDPTTINDEPNLEELEIASAFKLIGAYRIGSDGTQRIQDIKQAISSGYPVAIGTMVDQAFEDYNGKGVIAAPNPANLLGGHMMHLVGYRADGAFRGVNQWGTSWGDSGLYWASPAFVTTVLMSDIYVLSGVATGRSGGMMKRIA